MDLQKIANENLSLTVNPLGAEMTSLQDEDGVEYIWQADPGIWGRHAPHLFPIVGALRDGVYRYQGVEYPLPQHGFARDCKFETEEQIGQRLAFRLSSDVGTMAVYPFPFVFRVVYKLDVDTLVVSYEVENAGDAVMPFSVGAHPGFALSWPGGGKLTDYFLEFDRTLTCSRRKLDEEKLLSDREEPFLAGSNRMPITPDVFAEDAVILPATEVESVALRSLRSDRSLTVSFSDFSDLGIWAKPGAPYVCIEPWCGHVDPWDHNGEILEKPGIRLLDPGAVFTCRYSIRVSRSAYC